MSGLNHSMNIYTDRFRGRTAVITGGASGVGFDTAKRITAEGGTVALWDRDPDALSRAQEALGSALTIEVDVAEWLQIERAAQSSFEALGHIDIVVAGAGITGPNLSLDEYPIDDWARVINCNLTGVFYTCRAIVPFMRKADYGRIVILSSVAGKEGNPNASAYSASKAGVIGITKSLGKELAKTGIRVNAVTPAVFRSPMLRQMKPEFIDFMLSKIPMGRFGEPTEVTSMICWLASDEASFSTGAVFDISGGRSTY
jgi:NAD(P)-dependent dehydrogenase (short-subunit alcohol dehydrogenase family)